MSQPYVLQNRKAFADYIARIFLKYRTQSADPLDTFDNDEDLCLKRGDPSKNTQELFGYQKLVRDYLMVETPYRGLLLYHGLGTGKTCSSIGVAESLLSTKKVIVMLPASLQDNFRQQLRKCGDPIYIFNNRWQQHVLRAPVDRELPKSLGISDTFLDQQGRYFTTVPGGEPNYKDLPLDMRKGIDAQISDIINNRYTFINYNGLTSESVKQIVPDEDPSKSRVFDDHVILIDEVHNLIGRVVNKSEIATRLYQAMYSARGTKIVAMSGTPVINKPNEIAYLMNLLRGPIERIVIPVKKVDNWNESAMTEFFRKMPDVDTIEFNSIKRDILITRNPDYFRSVYNDKGDRIAVKYERTEGMTHQEPEAWVRSMQDRFVSTFAGAEFGVVSSEILECLPTKLEDFATMFLDGLTIKNALLFQRRIQGLVSYFKGADERMIPKRVDDDKLLEKVEMSEAQFGRYLEVRWNEIRSESKKAQKGVDAMDQNFSSYRVMSRLVCDYLIPPEIRGEALTREEDEEVEKPEILRRLKADPDRYLTEGALTEFSPKMKKILQNVRGSMGTVDDGFRNQFIYSNYKELEGLGVFGAILSTNGFQEYRLIKQDGRYMEDPAMDPTRPAYAFYTGGDKELREIMRYIFNEDYTTLTSEFPMHGQSIRDSIAKRGGKKLLCILMGSSAAAEGLNLKNVRHIHLIEPHWNPARHDQVIGRGIRICSHATRENVDGTRVVVPQEDRTIRVSFYVTVFSEDQAGRTEGPNIVPIRRNDMMPKMYDQPTGTDARPPEAWMTSDEFLYEVSYEKERVAKAITLLLKQAAVDCEIHRKLHSREQPVIQCMRFDTTVKSDDLASNPSYKSDEPDETYLRNTTRQRRRLQELKIRDFVFIVDRDSKEVFDYDAFQVDNQRLLQIGTLGQDRIQFFTHD